MNHPHDIDLFLPGANKIKLNVNVTGLLFGDNEFPIAPELFDALDGVWCDPVMFAKIQEVLNEQDIERRHHENLAFYSLFVNAAEESSELMAIYLSRFVELEPIYSLRELIEENRLPGGILSFKSNNGKLRFATENPELIKHIFGKVEFRMDEEFVLAFIGQYKLLWESKRPIWERTKKKPFPEFSLKEQIQELVLTDTQSRSLCAQLIREYCWNNNLFELENEFARAPGLIPLIKSLFVAVKYLDPTKSNSNHRDVIVNALNINRWTSTWLHMKLD